jgi:hypothetical protein
VICAYELVPAQVRVATVVNLHWVVAVEMLLEVTCKSSVALAGLTEVVISN